MITPIWTMKISEIVERHEDLLISADDIKELARNERAKAIEEFAEVLKRRYPIASNGLEMAIINSGLHKSIDEMAKELKGE